MSHVGYVWTWRVGDGTVQSAGILCVAGCRVLRPALIIPRQCRVNKHLEPERAVPVNKGIILLHRKYVSSYSGLQSM